MNLLEALYNRMKQNTEATQRGEIAGRNVGDIPLLGGILTSGSTAGNTNPLSIVNAANTLGVANEGAAGLAKAGFGALVGLGGAQTARYYDQHPDQTPTPEHAQMIEAWHALQHADPGKAEELQAQLHPLSTMASEAILNPLNFAGGAGEAGAALQAADRLPLLAQALKGVSLAGHVINEAPMVPLRAIGGGGAILRALRGVPEASDGLAAATAGLGDRLAAAVQRDIPNTFDTSLIGARGNVPRKSLPEGALPENPLQAALPEPTSLPEVLAQRRALPTTPAPDQLGGVLDVLNGTRAGVARTAQDAPAALRGLAPQSSAAAITPMGEIGAKLPPPAIETQPLDRLRALIGGEAERVGTHYPPNDAKFYADRLGLPEGDVPDLLRQLETDGTLGRDHTGALAVKPSPRAAHDPLAGLAPETGVPAEALTPDQERAAQGLWEGTVDPTPVDPGLPAVTGTRAEALAQLAPDEIDQLVDVAYPHEAAQANAILKYTDPAALADRAVERITTQPEGARQLARLNPELAQKLAYLPEAPAAIADTGAAADAAMRGVDDLFGTVGEQASTKPKTLGGDIAAGGGMGLTPYGGLPSALATRTLLGAGGGGLLGGAAGGVAGYAQGDRGDQLLTDASQGAALGLGLGAAGGAALPRLEQATTAALAQAGQRLPGILDDTVLDPATIAKAHGLAAAAQRAGMTSKGVGFGELPKLAESQWRAQATATAKNLAQDAGNVALLVHQFGPEFGATRGDVKTMFAQLRDNLGNPDRVAGYGDAGALLQDIGQGHLIDPKTGLSGLVGEDLISAANEQTPRGSLLQRTLLGGGIGLANAATRISPLAPLTGAVRGALNPYVSTFFGTLNGLQHNAPRVAFLQKTLERDLPQLANDFLGDLASTGVNTQALEALGGRFGPDDVKAAVMAQAGRGNLATQAATEWGLWTEALVRQRSDRIAHLFGDFRDKGAAATIGDRVVGDIGKIFPFATWSIKYAPVLAEMAANHPRLTAGIAGTLVADAARAREEGRKGYTVGTIPISTETPLLGLGARALLGGQAGTARINPLSLISPYGGDSIVNDESANSYQTPYQHLTNLANRVGMSPHPLIQAAAYATGQDFKGPNNLSRTAGLEEVGQLLPGALGTTMPSLQNTLDAARQAISGKGSAAIDPIERRYGELVLDQTGKPAKDTANVHYLLRDTPEAQALYEQAKRETILSGAAKNTTSLLSPASITTRAADAEAAAQSRAPLTEAQNLVARLPPAEAAALQSRIDAYKQAHPETMVYDAATKMGRAQAIMQAWEQQNRALQRVPAFYNYQRQIIGEQLGLVAPGTYANLIRSADLQNQQPGQGQIMSLPGMPMVRSPGGIGRVSFP